MKEIDARSLTQKEQYALRKRVVELRQGGMKNVDVAKTLGISEARASIVWNRFFKRGVEGILSDGKKGRPLRSGRRLSIEQEKEIVNLIIGNHPDQLGMSFRFWNRKAVSMLIKRYYKIELPIQTLSDYLNRWGFKVTKYVVPADNFKAEWISRWFDSEFPRIREKAITEGAEIHWGNRIKLLNINEYLTGTHFIKQDRYNMVSTITYRNRTRFSIYKEPFSGKMICDFMHKLLEDSGKKIYLIMYSNRLHKTAKVRETIDKYQNKLKVFFLPSIHANRDIQFFQENNKLYRHDNFLWNYLIQKY